MRSQHLRRPLDSDYKAATDFDMDAETLAKSGDVNAAWAIAFIVCVWRAANAVSTPSAMPISSSRGNSKEPVYAEYTEHYPPDTGAASLWLRNRQPEKWRDKGCPSSFTRECPHS
jgi:hypothetical protein